jgi:hypothetical protein
MVFCYLFIRIRFLVISPNERKNRIRTEREKDVPMQEKVNISSFNTKKSFASLAKKWTVKINIGLIFHCWQESKAEKNDDAGCCQDHLPTNEGIFVSCLAWRPIVR